MPPVCAIFCAWGGKVSMVVEVERKQTNDKYVYRRMNLSKFQCWINYLKRRKLDATVVFNACRIWIHEYQIERNQFDGFLGGFPSTLKIMPSFTCLSCILCPFRHTFCVFGFVYMYKTPMKRANKICYLYTIHGISIVMYCI